MSYARIARRIRVPLGFLFAAVYIWLARPSWPFLCVGAAIALAGVAIRAVASGHITKNDALTTTGPYAYTRNPLYFGSLVIAIGFTVAANNVWVFVIVAALFSAIYVPVIRSEEEFLRSKFPSFDAYAARVPRLVPTFKPADLRCTTSGLPAGDRVAFSWSRYRKHREYNALIGTVAMILALAAKMVWFR